MDQPNYDNKIYKHKESICDQLKLAARESGTAATADHAREDPVPVPRQTVATLSGGRHVLRWDEITKMLSWT